MTDIAFWDKVAPRYAKSKISDPDGYETTLARMAELLTDDMHVLEIGCGTGSTALRLAPEAAAYHGTDFAPGMIAIAEEKRAAADQPNLSFSVASAGALPDAPYDAVIALNLLHLLPDVETDLNAIHAGLAPSGMLISKTPLMRGAPWYLRLAIPVLQLFGKAPYFRSMDQQDMLTLLETRGFDVEETLVQPGLVARLFVVARKK